MKSKKIKKEKEKRLIILILGNTTALYTSTNIEKFCSLQIQHVGVIACIECGVNT